MKISDTNNAFFKFKLFSRFFLLQVERNIQQRHMVNWIVDNVKKAITTESEQENLKKCLSDLKALSVKA